MSPYSTMRITREDCIKQIRASLEDVLSTSSDESLEDLLFDVYGRERLYNFSIVEEYQQPDEYGWPIQYRNPSESSEYQRGYADAMRERDENPSH